jgi:hypothetical protein
MNLQTIARKYNTDKKSHGFIPIYNTIFDKYKSLSFNFLEIGVFFGESIKMWNEYFENATIFGLDTFEGKQGNGTIFKNANEYYNEWKSKKPKNIELIKADQSSINDLKKFSEYCKNNDIKFKFIIDDGSHLMRDQQITFFYLFDLLEKDGIYIIEDIHTSEQPGYDVLPDKSNSTKELFLKMKDGFGFQSHYIEDLKQCDNITQKVKNIELRFVKPSSQILVIYS